MSPVAGYDAVPGRDSFESVARAAFGSSANVLSMALVTAMCFFGAVGYAVLLRDMLQPITDAIWSYEDGGSEYGENGDGASRTWFRNNFAMLTVCLLVTPLCTLRTLTSLKRFGAASMFSVLILGCCVLYRSLQCNADLLFPSGGSPPEGNATSASSPSWSSSRTASIVATELGFLLADDGSGNQTANNRTVGPDDDGGDYSHHWRSFALFPASWKDVLDVFPLFVSCYVCHYNLLPVHNELREPTAKRVGYWLRVSPLDGSDGSAAPCGA
jgi:amino acid permease